MRSPMVVDLLEGQAHRRRSGPGATFPASSGEWSFTVAMSAAGYRLGACNLGGESLVLTSELLDKLSRMSCWLDGAVRVRLECRSTADLPVES